MKEAVPEIFTQGVNALKLIEGWNAKGTKHRFPTEDANACACLDLIGVGVVQDFSSAMEYCQGIQDLNTTAHLMVHRPGASLGDLVDCFAAGPVHVASQTIYGNDIKLGSWVAVNAKNFDRLLVIDVKMTDATTGEELPIAEWYEKKARLVYC